MGQDDILVRSVVEYFVSCDDGLTAQLQQWRSLPDDEFLRSVREHFEPGKDKSPALVWTTGLQGDRRRVKSWSLAEIPVECFYSMGINQEVRGELDRAKGNFVAFHPAAVTFPAFQPRYIPLERRRVIGIAHSAPGKKGSIELIDGAHRLTTMIGLGVQTVEAYIGGL